MSGNKTLNQKIEDLETKVEWFYSDEFNLDKATENYKDAIKIAKEIEKDLAELKNKIEVLSEDFSK